MRIGVAIVKNTLFRGVQQEFSNVYYYELPTAVTAPAESIIDEITAKEKTLHSTVVNFVRGLAWSAGGTPGQNQMLHQKALSGTGTQTATSEMDRERAVLIRWPAGFDSRGKPVYLRKWYHSCGACAGQALNASSVLANTSDISTATRNAIATSVNDLRQVNDAVDLWDICAKGGRDTTGPAECHRYLEHHQLGDQWR